MSGDLSEVEIIHLLPPWFNITVSINGHLQSYKLSSEMYSYFMEEEDVNPLNAAEVWTYVSNNLFEFLMSLTEEVGPIDPDRAKLVSMSTSLILAPEGLEGAVDCDGCEEEYREAVYMATGQDEDDDD